MTNTPHRYRHEELRAVPAAGAGASTGGDAWPDGGPGGEHRPTCGDARGNRSPSRNTAGGDALDTLARLQRASARMEAQILTGALDYLDRVAAQAEADYADHDRHLNRLQAAGDAHAASAAQAAGAGHSGSVQQVQAARGAAIYEIGQALG
ncbi:hypothetical protein, partial [Sediminivirga luteola]|uniref:hypothetical protein n=1 Tax=Sediminivirga luteola TaxID=1774748 RepID=UPI001F57774A